MKDLAKNVLLRKSLEGCRFFASHYILQGTWPSRDGLTLKFPCSRLRNAIVATHL